MLTHTNLVANLLQTAAATDCRQMTEEDTLIAVLPFFHIYGMVVIMNLAYTKVVRPWSFRASTWKNSWAWSDHGVTVAHLVPPIVLGLAKHPAVTATIYPSWTSSSAAHAARRRRCFGSMPAFGLRVTTRVRTHRNQPVTHLARTIGDNPSPVGSIGVNISNTEARIIDLDTEEEVTPGQTGELLVRGPQVMKGYLNNPLPPRTPWTPKVGYTPGTSRLWMMPGTPTSSTAVKELIKYKGMQVAPAA